MPVSEVPRKTEDRGVTEPHELGLVTVREAAMICDLHESQIYRAIKRRELRYAARDRAGGLLRRSEVEEWARTRPRRHQTDLPTLGEYARQIGASAPPPAGENDCQSQTK